MGQGRGMIPTVDVQEAQRRLAAPDAPLLVDVRERDEFAAMRVPGAVLLPTSQFATGYRQLPTDRPLLIMCAVGGRSARVTEALLGAGWTDVANVAGGINAWFAAGLPTRSGPPDPGEGDSRASAAAGPDDARGRSMPEEPAPRLLAGAPWRDRLRAPRPTDAARWFEPIHVREPARAEALAAQVEAGADVVTAPAWLTHRRALMEIGESRRAAEWTRAAVQLAREAVEEGLSRRGDVASGNTVLVAGPLPDLDARPETGSGRLAERGAAADRDREAQAGILAEAGVDLIVVEVHSSVEAATAPRPRPWQPGWRSGPRNAGPDAGEIGGGPEALAAAGASTILLEAPELP